MNWFDSVRAVLSSYPKKPSSMKAGGRCYEVVKHFESFREKAYKDTGGVWTVGYGETLGVTSNSTMTHDEALKALYRRMEADFADVVRRKVKVKLTQPQFDALCSFVYNIGGVQFAKSTLLAKLNTGDYEGASDEFPKWKYDNGIVQPGLVRRRACEKALFLGEDYKRYFV